jgi:hypothetical protein
MKFAIRGKFASIFLALDEIFKKGYAKHTPTETANDKAAIRTEKTKELRISRKKENTTSEKEKTTRNATRETSTIKPKYALKLILMLALAKLFFKLLNLETMLPGTNSDNFNRKVSVRLPVFNCPLKERTGILIVTPYGI